MIKGQKVKENNMSNYVISCCSTADLTREHMLERNIKYACFHYELDGKEYMDEIARRIKQDGSLVDVFAAPARVYDSMFTEVGATMGNDADIDAIEKYTNAVRSGVSKKGINAQLMKSIGSTDGKLKSAVSYEDMKDFHSRKEYEINVAKEHHIHMELQSLEHIVPILHGRNWLLMKSSDQSGPFITTDNPVNLTWNDPDAIPPVYRNSPGFGLKQTQVYFPLSKDLALLGEFDGREGFLDAPPELVAVFNSKMLMFLYLKVRIHP